MTLIGHRAQNHPQQIARRGAAGNVDDRAITDEDFAPLNARFRFTVDIAAAPHNAKLPRFCSADGELESIGDGLGIDWRGERVWCNPPYSDIRTWVKHAWHEWYAGSELIVMLLPANRTEQRWWQDLVEPALRGRTHGFRVEFLPGRMRFDRPGWTPGPKGNRPPFGCCLLIWCDA